MNKQSIFMIGHACYSGRNRQSFATGHSAALSELLRRGVSMRDAQKAIANAKRGSHATASVYKRFPDGYRCAIDTVELLILPRD